MSKYNGKFPSIYTTIDNGKKIGEMANKLAYSGNPKAAQWPSGKPTAAYKAAIKAQWSGKYYWSKASRDGASCDMFAGTSVKAGFDHNMKLPKPRPGLWILFEYFKTNKQYTIVGINTQKKITVTKKDLQDGDIILYEKPRKGVKRRGHICIYYQGQIKEASAKHYYGRTTDQVEARLNPAGKKYVYVFRAKDTAVYTPIKKGAVGANALRIQKFLNWYYADKIASGDMKRLTMDRKFGPLTERRLMMFQEANEIKPDGVCGKVTLAKMKAVNLA